MSALGQKQTFGPKNAMSALPPKADMVRRRSDVALCAKSGHSPSLFDHLVGAGNQRLGHGDTECLGGSLVDYQLHCRGLLNGQIRRLFAFEDPPPVISD